MSNQLTEAAGRKRRLKALGIRWASPDMRWLLSGGGPKSRGCVYTLTDTATGRTHTVRTLSEAKQIVGA